VGFVIPTMILVVVILYSAFNLVMASMDVTAAASAAARAASLQRSAPGATAAAQNAAAADLNAHQVTCAQLRVDTDTSRFHPAGAVSVTVQCVVRLRTLAGVTFLPGSMTTSASSTAPMDTFRFVSLAPPHDGVLP
jgi:hypothetical protein